MKELFERLDKQEQNKVLEYGYLIDDNKHFRKEIKRLNNRIDKAIEELDKYISYCETDGNSYDICKMSLNSMKKTKQILKGSDK